MLRLEILMAEQVEEQDQSKRISRRRFLKLAGGAAGVAVLTAAGLKLRPKESAEESRTEILRELKNRLPVFIRPANAVVESKVENREVLRVEPSFFQPQRPAQKPYNDHFELKHHYNLAGVEVTLLSGNCFNNEGDPVAILSLDNLDQNIVSVAVTILEDAEEGQQGEKVIKSRVELNRDEFNFVRDYSDPRNLEAEEKTAFLFVVPNDDYVDRKTTNALAFTARLPFPKNIWRVPGTAAKENREMRDPALEIKLTNSKGEESPTTIPLNFPPRNQ